MPSHTLQFLDPGHFHAALLLRRANPRIAPDVHVYAPAGAERDAFCALIEAFNAREQEPTHWRLHVHEARDRDAALAALLAERRGEAVVLAGRNRGKLAAIARLHEADLWVLADGNLLEWRFRDQDANDEAIRARLLRVPGAGVGASDPAAGVDHQGHLACFRDAVKAIRDGTRPQVDGREARKAVAIVCAVYESARRGGAAVVP